MFFYFFMEKLHPIESLDLSTFGGRLKYCIAEKYSNVNNFAKLFNYNVAQIQQYVWNKKTPSIDKLLEFAKIGLDVNFLLFGDNISNNEDFLPKDNEEETLLVPEFTSPVRGGTWNMVENDRYRLVSVPKMLVKGIKQPAKVDVIGMSMAPEIKYRDTVFFDMEGVPKNNDVVICTYNGDTMIKRYKSKKSGITLESNNPKFEPIPVEEGKQFVIHGVVKRVIHNL